MRKLNESWSTLPLGDLDELDRLELVGGAWAVMGAPGEAKGAPRNGQAVDRGVGGSITLHGSTLVVSIDGSYRVASRSSSSGSSTIPS